MLARLLEVYPGRKPENFRFGVRPIIYLTEYDIQDILITMDKETRLNNEKEFYAKCGEILNITHCYNTPFSHQTRWNKRTLGNGRYKGVGVIKYFNSELIHILSKQGSKTCTSEEEVYEFLKQL